MTGARCSLGVTGVVAGAVGAAPPAVAVVLVRVVAEDSEVRGADAAKDPEAVPPVEAAIAAGAAGVPPMTSNQEHYIARKYPQDNLFRRPAGLADGLALKEPAPPTATPWNSPQHLGSPVPWLSNQGFGISRGSLAECK